MNHSVKRRRQALHQTHHHYYLNISVEAAKLSDWRIESNRIESFFARIGMLYEREVFLPAPIMSVCLIQSRLKVEGRQSVCKQ